MGGRDGCAEAMEREEVFFVTIVVFVLSLDKINRAQETGKTSIIRTALPQPHYHEKQEEEK